MVSTLLFFFFFYLVIVRGPLLSSGLDLTFTFSSWRCVALYYAMVSTSPLLLTRDGGWPSARQWSRPHFHFHILTVRGLLLGNGLDLTLLVSTRDGAWPSTGQWSRPHFYFQLVMVCDPLLGNGLNLTFIFFQLVMMLALYKALISTSLSHFHLAVMVWSTRKGWSQPYSFGCFFFHQTLFFF